MPEGDKFLNNLQIKTEAKRWQKQANRKERPLVKQEDPQGKIYSYQAFREDSQGSSEHGNSIDDFHKISFIGEVIPKLIAHNPGRKLQILDVGAGMTVFTNQIRNTFGGQVRVFSTGLSKQAFKSELKLNKKRESEYKKNLPPALHPDDLKWRSIRELSDYEEFDLIIDTYGEFIYSRHGMRDEFVKLEDFERIFEYISIVCRKLRQGGLASIAPISFESEFIKNDFESNLRQAAIHFGVSFILEHLDQLGDRSTYILRIRKTKSKSDNLDPNNAK